MYRCYYDASYYVEKKNGVAGVYIEDEEGRIIMEKKIPFEGIVASQDAEAFALKKALEVIAPYNQQQSIYLLGDCKSLIEGIWGGNRAFEALRDKLKEAKCSPHQLVWIYREYNKAHNLTQPAHIELERPVYAVDVVYTLTEEAYEQYNYISTKQKKKPFALIEKKINQHIEETKYFSIKMDNDVQAFFRYGFIFFTKDGQIISIYKSEDNKNQYGNCQKSPLKLKQIFNETMQTLKNQA